ncbi:preprotein translocase subunit TatC [Aeromicrobium sp. Root236]|uniref:twin-arginine translocase subunit TatC n=1 Tax=Aeromicrobium sp. Root236 TaxID=1736498 RepID=UPI0006FACDDF|nr:twin-arginine translocase subunit TatC [Aeromicrobium sp. Root236]KRC65837.1 preprotein translocase subunit TatC [Aeromicrobium sp. Root236]
MPRRTRNSADGSMPLVEHLRELRRRLTISAAAVAIATIAGWFLFDPIFTLITDPYVKGIAPLVEGKNVDAQIVISGGVGAAFNVRIKLAVAIGVVVASPVWINQAWRFILPALHRREKRWAYLMTATGAPLFIGGAFIGYLVLPKGIEVLIGFIPDSIASLTSLDDYLSFVLRTMLVFGIAAEIPLVVVMLNRLGLVSPRQLASARPWTVIGIFVFAAIATPSTDPLTMLILAAPMTVLYLIAEIIARVVDRRRASVVDEALADDELSRID